MPEPVKSSRINWLLWWRVDHDEVETQVAEYQTLKFFSLYKNWAAVGLMASAALTSTLTLLRHRADGFADAGIDLMFAALIYLGYRQAMICAMAWWTLEQLVRVANNPGSAHFALAMWALYMHAFYMAYLVEKRRRQPMIGASAF